jgi:small subunit ribosomal protein S2e
MAEEAGRGGFGRGGKDDRGRGRGGPRGRGRGRGKGDDKEEWVPVTKLGRLVKDGKIKSVEEIFLYSLPIKEYQIVDHLIGPALRDEVMKIAPVQKQTTAGQRTRFKCYVAVGDGNGHIGLGLKAAKEVATAIRGGIINAKMNLMPVRRGYWGLMSGMPHTVPCKVSGKCGSVRVRLIPAPRGSGLVASLIPKKLLNMAGIEDCYTSSSGHSRTRGNLAMAVYQALGKTYSFLSPELWTETEFKPTPAQEYTDHLAKKVTKVANYA